MVEYTPICTCRFCTFSPHGHYFVSVGRDRMARLWTTDHYQPVRMFAGHLSDVDVSLYFIPYFLQFSSGPSSILTQG